ncbi:MAG: V-type ATPase subunit [Candidatus Geothermincolia bacterium]
MRTLPGIKGGKPERPRFGLRGSHPDWLRDARVVREPTRYGYASGRIKVKETQLLNRQRLGRLIEADFEEALRILEEMDYGQYVVGARFAREVDGGLTGYLADLYDWLRHIAPISSHISEFVLSRYDFHNLKVFLKSYCCGGDATQMTLELGTLPVDVLRRAADEPHSLPSHLAAAALEVLAHTPISAEQVDLIVDRRYLEHRLRLARAERSGFMIEFSRAAIDLANFKLLLRGRNLGKEPESLRQALAAGGEVPAGELGSLAGKPVEEVLRRLERTRQGATIEGVLALNDRQVRMTEYDRLADDILMRQLRKARRVAVGVEPILGYVSGRENEVMYLRVILMAKLHNLTPEQIESRVRLLYADGRDA